MFYAESYMSGYSPVSYLINLFIDVSKAPAADQAQQLPQYY